MTKLHIHRWTKVASYLWFAALLLGVPASSFAQSVSFTEYPTAGNSSYITVGPDGALWFTDFTANQIGRITAAGAVTEYPVPTSASLVDGITTGPDGALWFTEFQGNQIGRITTAGVISEYALPQASEGPR